MKKAAELKKLMTQATDFRAELERRENDGEEIGAEDRTKLNAMIDRGFQLREEIEKDEQLDELASYASQPNGQKVSQLGFAQPQRKMSWGEIVVASEAFKFAHGRALEKMDRVQVKDLHGETAAAGGAFVVEDRDEPVALAKREFRVLDLVNRQQTGSNAVEYVRQTTRTDAAAAVLDYDAGDFVSKPESNLVFELVTAPVRTIPTWIPASRNILSDAPQLRGLIDSELRYMVEGELDNQIVNGDNTGANFDGILGASNVQTRTQGDVADRGGELSDTKADALRRAITDIQLAFYQPDAILLNPGDAEDIELQKTSEGDYVQVYDPVAMRIWRVRVVESSVIAAGTGLVGNFYMGATLWDRMNTEIRVGEPNDFFLKNAVAVLAELRAAFGVKRPTAFEVVTFA